MNRLALLFCTFLLAALPAQSLTQAAPAPSQSAVAWPQTDAGRMASAWINAVNANDPVAYKDFVSAHFSEKRLRGRTAEDTANQQSRLFGQIAPLQLVAITKSEPAELAATLKTRTGDLADLRLATDPGEPSKIDVLEMARHAAGAGQSGGGGPERIPDTPLAGASATQMCETTAYAIEAAYVDRAKAPQFAAALREACAAHVFEKLTKRTFLREFTDKLRQITGDRHMYVRYDRSEDQAPPRDKSVVEQAMKEWRAAYGRGAQTFAPAPPAAADRNWAQHGLAEVKMLDGGIGYISATVFPDIKDAGGAASAAMREVADAKALIFDLRDMRGGSQEMVNLLCSYLFSDPHKHLLSTVFPALKASNEQYTYADINGPRRPKLPVYILTSGRTFSAGEAFAYILQQFQRATVVGEKTAGGGHLNEFIPLGEGFLVSISVGTAIHPVSKKGWDGVGVVPDVAVPAGEALERARTLAAEKSGTNRKSE